MTTVGQTEDAGTEWPGEEVPVAPVTAGMKTV